MATRPRGDFSESASEQTLQQLFQDIGLSDPNQAGLFCFAACCSCDEVSVTKVVLSHSKGRHAQAVRCWQVLSFEP